ncbi:uncharacterized protein LOC34624611 [Cyclospora cayetanensis]|uniref:Uncharacterized protein LOC34624611 n=1 Tax=Cyclospora cayetanensis TaxID=88456 RepID=A0A6P6RRN7_9EIME|nr:uncharacterized protein LOC34624611 [Cyclospora cayetanensis]
MISGLGKRSGCSATAAAQVPQYDIQFGGLLVRLLRKLSAKCHCQFDVWEAEAVGVADAASAAAVEAAAAAPGSEGAVLTTAGGRGGASELAAGKAEEEAVVSDGKTLGALHMHLLGLHRKFAIKLLEVDRTEASRLKYRTHSVLQEGLQLRDLCEQLWNARAAAAASGGGRFLLTTQQKLLLLQLQQEPLQQHPELLLQQLDPQILPQRALPVPRYFWTARGVTTEGCRVLGVGMERIEGRTLTQVLQQMRIPSRASSALLILEICIKFVRSQKVLACDLKRPLINWDTKPGNVLVELTRSATSLHCLRCVIIDLGDALPGPSFLFPTRHQPGISPSYVICTKGSCSPECAILVFLLASGSKSESFRKTWYGEVDLQRMIAAKRERLQHRWQRLQQLGVLRRKVHLSRQPPGADGQMRPPLERGFWEVEFTEGSVVFSTGLVLAQLMGGPNLIHVVNRNEVLVLDMLCEWGFEGSTNLFSQKPNLGPNCLLPQSGVFSQEPWLSLVRQMLHNTLAFCPTDRWSFAALERFLVSFHRAFKEYCSGDEVAANNTLQLLAQRTENKAPLTLKQPQAAVRL